MKTTNEPLAEARRENERLNEIIAAARRENERLREEISRIVADCQAGGPALTNDEVFARYGFALVMRALPHLQGDALLHISSVLPPLAKTWEVRENLRWRRNASPVGGDFARVERRFRPQTQEPFWTALTWHPNGQVDYSEHDDPIEAQAACDTRLQAMKVVPCGRIVVFPAPEVQAAS